MSYALICTAAVLFSLQFLFQKDYKNKYGSGLKAGLNFQMYASAVGAAVIFAVNVIVTKKIIGFSAFTVITAFVYAIFTIAFSVVSLKAMETANVAIYSMFAMLGGMFVPFIYGVIVNKEALGYKKIIGIVLMAAALICSSEKTANKAADTTSKTQGENAVTESDDSGGVSRTNKKAYLYYAAVFLLNGSFGVISSFHQSPKFSGIAASGYSLMVYAQIFASIISLATLLVLKCGIEKLSPKIFGLTSLYAGVNGLGNLFTVLALLTLPASVQYPIITGGTIIVSSAVYMISKKKFSLKYAIAAAISLSATVLFVI